MTEVVHFQRKPRAHGNYSLESYFKSIRELTPADIRIGLKLSRFESKGLWRRIYNVFEAAFSQKQVNHVTGDVHFLTLLLKRKKTLLTILDCGRLQELSGIRFKLFKYFWFTLPAKKSAYITVISKATREDLLQHIHYDPARIRVIYVNIPDLYRPSDKPFNEARPLILQVGTARNKNLERIIPALEGLSCRYRILGPLTEVHAALLKKHKLEYEHIDRVDTDAEVFDLYQSCDIVSFASTVEGFGMPILEGNATGRVVVTGNTSSMPEIAADAACLVDPWDIESIRNGFRKVIADPDYRNQLIRNGFQNVRRFDKEHIANQYFNLYRELVSNG